MFKLNFWKSIFFLIFITGASLSTSLNIYAQRVGFISSQMIRDHLPDSKIAEQRVQTMVEEWKRELASMDEKIKILEFDIKKNRLIWSDSERNKKEKELLDLQLSQQKYAKEKYESGGEYYKIVNEVMKPVEEKIFAAVQQVASKEKYDIIWDQSTQPLAYVNFKYDITLKVLRLLGVDVDALEKEQNEKIAKDPRNEDDKKRKDSQQPRRRSRTATKDELQKEQELINKEQQLQKEKSLEEREIKR